MGHELTRIAYVEDEPDIRFLTEMSLEAIGGFDVASYETGHEALQKMEAFNPDLILLDVMMPEMSGPEILRRLLKEKTLKNIPVVFITAKSSRSDIDEMMADGAIGVISKPYDPMTLADEVRFLWSNSPAKLAD